MPGAGGACEKRAMEQSRTAVGTTRMSVRQELERARLEHRARRLRLVVSALRERSLAAAQHGSVPPALQRALMDFSGELAEVRARLGRLRHGDGGQPGGPQPI
jgi:hypothetical protein